MIFWKGPGLAKQEGPDTKGRRQQDHLRCPGTRPALFSGLLKFGGCRSRSRFKMGRALRVPNRCWLLEVAVLETLREVNVNP